MSQWLNLNVISQSKLKLWAREQCGGISVGKDLLLQSRVTAHYQRGVLGLLCRESGIDFSPPPKKVQRKRG
jgi:hypothetical protein